MTFLSHLWSTIVAIHANAVITIWTFFTNNLTMLLVIVVVGYLFKKEIESHDHEFVQDRRRIL